MPIRLRLVAVFTMVAALTTALGGLFLLAQLEHGLVASLDQTIAVQWTQVRQALNGKLGQENFQESGGSALGSSKATKASLFPPETQYIVQVFNQRGRLIESNQAAGTAPLLTLTQVHRAAQGSLALTVLGRKADRIRLVAAPTSSNSPRVVLVGASLDTVDRSVATVRRDLLLGGFIIVLATLFGTYLLAASALLPVERLRRQVEELSALDSEVAVEVPKPKDEIAALAKTMNSLLGRLHRALVRQRSFVADAGHELRTPFAILRTELELAARPGRTRAELEEAIERASFETVRLSRLAEDLLFLARGDEVAAPMDLTRTVLRDVLVRAADLSHHRAAQAKVALVVNASADLEVTMDAGRIRQAIDNLLDNALRYAPLESEITIVADISDGVNGREVYISVADRGPGFSPEFLPHAFERFRRPDDGRARTEGGAGLGLAVVASIAASHGGAAVAENRVGGGAIVTVTFPSNETAPT
jgi:two-component system OmpR family sensor kinase